MLVRVKSAVNTRSLSSFPERVVLQRRRSFKMLGALLLAVDNIEQRYNKEKHIISRRTISFDEGAS